MRTFVLSAALVLAGCHDLPTVAAPAPGGPAPSRVLRCSARVHDPAVQCEAVGASGPRGNLILGGQGVNVRLRSSNVAYDGALRVLGADVAVQNLLDQPLGTDGTTPSAVRVFFSSGPKATDGSGSVTVMADGTGTFLAAGQPYYQYDGAIDPRAISPPRRWQFKVDAGVNAFEFQVYVDTPLPWESGFLHWENEIAIQFGSLSGVWAASDHDVFAVSHGTVLHFDGNYWQRMETAGGCGELCGVSLNAVWGTGPADVYAVGAAGAVMRWRGDAWKRESDPDLGAYDYYGVWAAAPGDVWAVGNGRIVRFDGADWTAVPHPAPAGVRLRSVWGAGPGTIWAVGDSGTILYWNGSSWTSQRLPDPVPLRSVWGTSPTDVWAAGADDFGCKCAGGYLYHFDGNSWQSAGLDLLTFPRTAGWSSGPSDVWVAGFNTSGYADLFHYDGSTWTADTTGTGSLLGIHGTSSSNVFAVGAEGLIVRHTGTGWKEVAHWQPEVHGIWGSSATDVWAARGSVIHRTADGWTLNSPPWYIWLQAIWGTGPSDVWAVGPEGALAHYNGVSWTVNTADVPVYAVWGTSPADMWAAAGSGRVYHFNGTKWSYTTVGSAQWKGVWGTSASDAYVVGTGGNIRRWTGAGWVPMNSGTTQDLLAVWGSGPGDVYAVGNAGTVLRYDGNAAGAWLPVSTPVDAASPVTAVWGSAAGNVYLLANQGSDLVHWDGASWRIVASPSGSARLPMYALWGFGSHDIYLGAQYGAVIHGHR